MTKAPERIWADPPETFDGMDIWRSEPGGRSVEYIRADLVPQWQPIETAPKDGTYILAAWVPGNMPRFVRVAVLWQEGCWRSTWNHDEVPVPDCATFKILGYPPA